MGVITVSFNYMLKLIDENKVKANSNVEVSSSLFFIKKKSSLYWKKVPHLRYNLLTPEKINWAK